MRILYYTSGTTGSGRVVLGLAIGNAIRRRGLDAEFTILSSSPFGCLADCFGYPHVEIPLGGSADLGAATYRSSHLFVAIDSLKPDVLLVDLYWMPLQAFLPALPCKKIFLCRQVDDRYFSVPVPDGVLTFQAGHYDLILSTEPFQSSVPMRRINPLVLRDRHEILSRENAASRLGLNPTLKACLVAHNGEPGEFERLRRDYAYLEDAGYQVVYSSNYHQGIFPAVDYFSAFDLIVTGAGYNSFWEVVYFRKEAIFVPVPRRFEDQRRRVEELQEYVFDRNGADELVELLTEL